MHLERPLQVRCLFLHGGRCGGKGFFFERKGRDLLIRAEISEYAGKEPLGSRLAKSRVRQTGIVFRVTHIPHFNIESRPGTPVESRLIPAGNNAVFGSHFHTGSFAVVGP